ncbi:hypothetical protein AO278_08105 [Pseudomonas syringae pv. syringae]|uniref:hypothetical protein n=1 Tax=Pseudomonas syringae TaxID=317 RepID=UPI000C12B6A4|nr:hypothetical protein [Pseudomonas syringae]PHX32560.1 hypothetical protein AO278_08105 [Pseudomonas syringae pv. syringae]
MKSKRLVYGVGLNDVSLGSGGHGPDPFYVAWHGMLKRCYAEKYIARYPAYRGCSVCSEWLKFSAFREWMLQQCWEGMVLDKDLLVPENRIYSPDTCAFIPAWLNNFLSNLVPKTRSLPMGVATARHRFTARYGCRESAVVIGHFDTPEQAHAAYRRYRLTEMRSRIARYLEDYSSDSKVSEALCALYEREVAEVDQLPPSTDTNSDRRKKLTADQVSEIKNALASGVRNQSALAKEYGVGKSTIRDIAHGRTRKVA